MKHVDWLCTASGRRVSPLHIKPSDIRIEDVAHQLSNLCRYTGATRRFYSVAQHSVLVSFLVPEKDALWAISHDLSEAYIGDIARPIKYTSVFKEYRQLEEKIMRAVAIRFDLPWPQPESVTVADMRIVVNERRDLLPHVGQGTRGWNLKHPPYPGLKIVPWSPLKAKAEFLARFAALR